MYVVPTPFHLVEGVAHDQTLILPDDVQPGNEFISVGMLKRREAAEMVVGYAFNLKTNNLSPQKIANPFSGKEHVFQAWRLKGSAGQLAAMRSVDTVAKELAKEQNNDHE